MTSSDRSLHQPEVPTNMTSSCQVQFLPRIQTGQLRKRNACERMSESCASLGLALSHVLQSRIPLTSFRSFGRLFLYLSLIAGVMVCLNIVQIATIGAFGWTNKYWIAVAPAAVFVAMIIPLLVWMCRPRNKMWDSWREADGKYLPPCDY